MHTLEHLGRVVRFHRETLGLTQLDLAKRGGPSNTTLTKIENGEEPPPSPSTLRKLDAGFGWPQGTARRVLHEGIEPRYQGGRWFVPDTTAIEENALDRFSDDELLDELLRRRLRGTDRTDRAEVVQMSDRRAKVTDISEDADLAAYTPESYEGDPSVDTFHEP